MLPAMGLKHAPDAVSYRLIYRFNLDHFSNWLVSIFSEKLVLPP
jgi:hypothetical protein